MIADTSDSAWLFLAWHGMAWFMLNGQLITTTRQDSIDPSKKKETILRSWSIFLSLVRFSVRLRERQVWTKVWQKRNLYACCFASLLLRKNRLPCFSYSYMTMMADGDLHHHNHHHRPPPLLFVIWLNNSNCLLLHGRNMISTSATMDHNNS